MPNPYENRSNQEGASIFRPQRKIGLETPLQGRFWGENKRLIFAPPNWYHGLVVGCLGFGLLLFLSRQLGWGILERFNSGSWVGIAVFLAGVWALLSMEFVVFDLRSRTYIRREGGGLLKRTRSGSLTEVDAVVLYCENYPYAVMGRIVIYRIVIHWKNAQVPLLVTDRDQATIPPGAPLNYLSGRLYAMAQRYSQALGCRFFDNSHFHSPPPQAPV